MVFNILFDIFGHFWISSKFGTLDPYFSQRDLSNARKRKFIFVNWRISNLEDVGNAGTNNFEMSECTLGISKLWNFWNYEILKFWNFDIFGILQFWYVGIHNTYNIESNNSWINGLVMVHGSRLVAQGQEKIGPRARGLEPRALRHEPWALSLAPWAMNH